MEEIIKYLLSIRNFLGGGTGAADRKSSRDVVDSSSVPAIFASVFATKSKPPPPPDVALEILGQKVGQAQCINKFARSFIF